MMKPRYILIAGGETRQRRTLAEALEAGGAFRVSDVASALEAMARTEPRTQRFDAIIVDAALPDASAPELCARIRRRGLRVPIVVLSDLSTESDVVRALDAGANDYMNKPFRLAELMARLRVQIREHDTSEDAVLLIGPYHFRPALRSLHEPVGNVQIRLTQKEVAILNFLYRASGRSVSGQTLLQKVWGYSSATCTHTVGTHIYRLRQKIEPDPVHPTILLNDGGGYSLGHCQEAETFWPPLPQPGATKRHEHAPHRYAYAN